MPRLSANQRLALARLQHGLIRRLHGWQTDHPTVDPADLVHRDTVKSLLRMGLAALTEDGARATVKPS